MSEIIQRTGDALKGALTRLGLIRKRGLPMGERWRILVVDDDPDVLDLIRLRLADEYDVLCVDKANDVGMAVDLFEPDLIVLDIMLPRISGYQIMEYLKRNPATANIPVCFLSAKTSARDLKYGYSLGASLYLTKPFQPERLIKNIKLQFDRMSPVQRKQRLIAEINEQLRKQGLTYQVATVPGEPTPAPEAAKGAKPQTARPITPPPGAEKDRPEEEKKRGPQWVD